MRPVAPRRSGPPLLAALLASLIGAPALAADGPSQDDLDFFETRIRPVLVEKCLSCHGEFKQESGLRLDSREALIKGGNIEGASFLDDEPESSSLLLVVKHELDNLKMPPEGGKLPDQTIADLETWLRKGAPWPADRVLESPGDDATRTHWAYQPVRHPEPPAVSDPSWVATPVDAFILSRLDAAGLKPSPAADRRTLLRRITFDLTGLPPTPEEVDAFLADPAPNAQAYAAVVDRLLQSPHYGERWGRHWLDIARYSDTKGYVFTEERRYPHAYTYRDYVVKSFNDDKPYDRFIVEQIAADQVDGGQDTAALAAMGFLTVGRRFLNNQQDIIDDRIDVVSRGLLGLTVACARCHDHKYDPIPAADYYSLYGVFASCHEPESLPQIGENTPGPEVDDYNRQRAERQKAVEDFVAKKRTEIRDDLRAKAAAYLAAARELDFQAGNGGKLDEVARSKEIDPGRLRFFANRMGAALKQAQAGHDPVLAPWLAMANVGEEGFAAEAARLTQELCGNPEKTPNRAVVAALLEGEAPASFPQVIERYGKAIAGAGALPEAADGRADLLAWLDSPASPFQVPPDADIVRILNRAERNEHRELEKKVDALEVTHPGSPPRAMVLADNEKPFNPYVFLRGNQGNRGPEVPRRFLKVIAGDDRPEFKQGSGRLELARAIADPSNPLTPRVMANRVWMHHFVKPLVDTPSDFGVRSEPPSHPDLLDWLASEFVARGWSVKQLHRLIVLSNTYQQASLPRAEAASIDPENRLLWRQNRRRLEFEAMRDSLLAASGRLDARVGGRPAEEASKPSGTRRTIYSHIDRQNLDAVHRTFDFASPDYSSPGRPRTTVPQQALFLMNSAFAAEQARALARRVDGEADPAAKVDTLYRLALQRPPTDTERDLGARFLSAPVIADPNVDRPFAYGFGRFDDATATVPDFQPLPHWTGKAWQFGPELPHPDRGYINLTPRGGHAPRSAGNVVVLRFTAPADGVYSARVSAKHDKAEGDGVRVRLLAAGKGVAAETIAHNGRSNAVIERVDLKAGETIDFALDPRDSDSHDSFEWSPAVTLVEAPSDGPVASGRAWRTSEVPAEPAPEPLTPAERYAQILLMANEFHFVD